MNSFAQASSVPAPQFRNPSFTTPRKGTFDLDLQSEQSGIESSPGGIADGEDTPDLPRANKSTMAILTGGPQKQPIFSKYGSAYSPGRLEQRRGKVGSTLMKHTRKRQRRERDEMALIGGRVYGSDSESEGDTKPKSKAKNAKQDNKPHWFTTMMSSIESHPNVPHVLTNYAQFGYNFFLLSITTFGLYSFWMTIRADVDKAAEEAKAGVLAEIAQCTRDYVQNGCAANNRAPALESVCHNWESCMSRDADSVGRAAVSASTFARILNSFVEPISYKTMVSSHRCLSIVDLALSRFALAVRSLDHRDISFRQQLCSRPNKIQNRSPRPTNSPFILPINASSSVSMGSPATNATTA